MLIRLRRLGPETERCSVCQDQNTWASVPLTARFTHTPPAHVYSQPTQTVCEWGPFFTPLPTSPLFLPNKHCTGNCRDCWDFSGGPGRKEETTRTRLLSVTPWRWVVGCTCEDGGSRVEGVTPALGGWWVLSLRYKQVKVTQFPVTPSSTSGRPGGCAKLDLSAKGQEGSDILVTFSGLCRGSSDGAPDHSPLLVAVYSLSYLHKPAVEGTQQPPMEPGFHNSPLTKHTWMAGCVPFAYTERSPPAFVCEFCPSSLPINPNVFTW